MFASRPTLASNCQTYNNTTFFFRAPRHVLLFDSLHLCPPALNPNHDEERIVETFLSGRFLRDLFFDEPDDSYVLKYDWMRSYKRLKLYMNIYRQRLVEVK